VLFLGVLGALVFGVRSSLRVGAHRELRWILYLFAAFLLYTGYR
jgi:hypothetical protein